MSFSPPLIVHPHSAPRGRVLYDRFGRALNLSTNEYGELKVALRETVFDLKQVDEAPDERLVTSLTTPGGTLSYSRDQSSTFLDLDTTPDARVVFQSRRSWHYQPSKRALLDLTFGIPSVSLGAIVRCGLFNDDDGVFFERNSYEAFGVRSSVSGAPIDTLIPRTSWNRDILDGLGASGQTLENDSRPIFFTAFSWFGVGDVVFGFVINGVPAIAHIQQHALLPGPYMRTPDLPVRWEAVNGPTGAEANTSLQATCCSVAIEGGQQALGLPDAFETAAVLAVGAATTQELVSIRLAPGVNHTVIPAEASISCASAQDIGFAQVLWNPTFAVNPAAVWVKRGPVEYNVTSRVVTNPGVKCYSKTYSTASGETQLTPELLALGRDASGTPDVITLAIRSVGAQNVIGSLGIHTSI